MNLTDKSKKSQTGLCHTSQINVSATIFHNTCFSNATQLQKTNENPINKRNDSYSKTDPQ